MKTTANIQHSTLSENLLATSSLSVEGKFSTWCKSLEPMRCLVLSVLLLLQGCIIVPASLLVSSFHDIGLGAISLVCALAGTVGVLVSNISELPMKAIVIIFALNLAVNLSLILLHVFA